MATVKCRHCHLDVSNDMGVCPNCASFLPQLPIEENRFSLQAIRTSGLILSVFGFWTVALGCLRTAAHEVTTLGRGQSSSVAEHGEPQVGHRDQPAG